MLVALALCVGGCGGGKHAAKAPASGPQQQQAPGAAGRTTGPHGHLSDQEYRAIVREYRRFDALRSQLSGANPGSRALRAVAAVCVAVARPPTVLVGLVSQDCRNAVRYRDNTGDLERASQKCQRGPRAKVPDCAARAYVAFAAGVRKTLATARAINAELAKRGIGGVCQTSIGISPAAIARLMTEAEAADNAASALRAGDGSAFDAATQLLQQALLAESDQGDPLPGIVHACPHATAPKPAPKQSAPKKANPRHVPPKPRLRQPGEGINI